MTFEHLVPVTVQLEGLVPTETLRKTSRMFQQSFRQVEDGGRGRGLGYLVAQGHLEDVAVAAATEQKVVAGVRGDRHDLNVEEDREKQLT